MAVNILDSGSPDQLRERAFRALDGAQVSRQMADRLIRGAQRQEAEAAHWAALADQREEGRQ